MRTGERLTIEAEMNLLSPMHSGSGVVMEDQDNVDISTILTDHNGWPYVAGSTVKGIIRKLVEDSGALSNEQIGEVFGTIKNEGAGAPGLLMAFGLECINLGKIGERLNEEKRDNGTYSASRNSIDRASGTAADHKLFRKQMAARGARFTLKISIAGRYEVLDKSGASFDALTIILKALSDPRGISFGSGRNDGQGRMKLDKLKSAIAITIDNEGNLKTLDHLQTLKTRIDNAKAPAIFGRQWSFDLSAQDTFAILGQKPDKAQETNSQVKGSNNKLSAIRHDNANPDLPGTSLSGSLRTNAEWFLKRERLRDLNKFPDIDHRDDTPKDPVLRLFGETSDELKAARREGAKRSGWAGLLRLLDIKDLNNSTRTKTLTSVKLDRVTSAPIDGALFDLEVFEAPRFRVSLGLDKSRTSEDDEKFAEAFFEYLSEDKFAFTTIGHGGNRGHGWFEISDMLTSGEANGRA